MNLKSILFIALLGAVVLYLVGIAIGFALFVLRVVGTLILLLILACTVLYLLEKLTRKRSA